MLIDVLRLIVKFNYATSSKVLLINTLLVTTACFALNPYLVIGAKSYLSITLQEISYLLMLSLLLGSIVPFASYDAKLCMGVI